jgi:hypothetical protein
MLEIGARTGDSLAGAMVAPASDPQHPSPARQCALMLFFWPQSERHVVRAARVPTSQCSAPPLAPPFPFKYRSYRRRGAG